MLLIAHFSISKFQLSAFVLRFSLGFTAETTFATRTVILGKLNGGGWEPDLNQRLIADGKPPTPFSLAYFLHWLACEDHFEVKPELILAWALSACQLFAAGSMKTNGCANKLSFVCPHR